MFQGFYFLCLCEMCWHIYVFLFFLKHGGTVKQLDFEITLCSYSSYTHTCLMFGRCLCLQGVSAVVEGGGHPCALSPVSGSIPPSKSEMV